MFFSKRQQDSLKEKTKPLETNTSLSFEAVTVTVEMWDGTARKILDDISLKLTASRTAVLGLNGTGKTTLLGLCNGLVTPTEGTVKVCGLEVPQQIHTIRQSVGMLFASPEAQLIMPTVSEDLELSLRRDKSLSPTQRRKRSQEILTSVGLEDKIHQSIFSLSEGEKQLVALAGLLAVNPRILLFDEPTTLLDLRNRQRLINLLDELDQMLIISTHDLDLAQTCDEAVIIHNGRLIHRGDARQAVQLYQTYCHQGFPGEKFQTHTLTPSKICTPPENKNQ